MDPTFLTQLQQTMTALACAAVTAGVGYGMTWLSAKLHIAKTDNAETSVRTAAATEAGVIAAQIPATATAASTAPAAMINPGVLTNAANKVITDLPAEVKLTGYTPKDIEDMVLSNLPSILGAVNPALGAAAGAAAGVVRAVTNG
jgi:hypothetical protein